MLSRLLQAIREIWPLILAPLIGSAIDRLIPIISQYYWIIFSFFCIFFYFRKIWDAIPYESPKFAWTRALLAYFIIIYFFAEIYFSVSKANPRAFSTEMSPFDYFYFSIVTMATVGYGDIVPVSIWAKFLVCCQIIIGTAYSLLIFGMVAAQLATKLGGRSQPGSSH